MDRMRIFKLEEVAELVQGGNPKTTVKEYWGNEIMWITPKDLELGVITFINDSQKKITKSGLEYSSTKILPPGTVLFSTRATIGKIGIALTWLTTNQGFTNFVCNDRIHNQFLAYALMRYSQEIANMGRGRIFKEVSLKTLKQFEISVPAFHEQEVVVDKLNKIFNKLENALKLAEESQKNLKLLKKRIVDEEIRKGEMEGWPKLEFTDFASFSYGQHFKSDEFVNMGVPVVNVGQLKEDGSFDLSNCKYIAFSRMTELWDKRIYKDDILIPLIGSAVGEVFWVDKDHKELIRSYNIGSFDVVEEKCTKPFLKYVLTSSFFQASALKKTNQGTSVINKRGIHNIQVPIPPIATQKKITAKLGSIFKNQAKLEESLSNEIKGLVRLKETVLVRTFKR